MFKPSLRKSILNDNLCLASQVQNTCFEAPKQQKRKPVPKFITHAKVFTSTTLPSMMIPQEILQKSTFSNDLPFTHVFTPFTYDFKPYPKAVKEIIKFNPKAAQAGRIHEINYVVFQKCILFWASNPSNPDTETLKVHRFKENIDIVSFSTIRNERMFKNQQVTVMAVTFGNRMKLFKVNQKELTLQDLMIKYQIKGSKKIQKVCFSDFNEIAFAGDNGQVSMISLNNSKQMVVKVQSPLIKKYLSKSAFDYSTIHIVRQIQVGRQFLYCLHDRISKSNYLMYLLKKAVNKVISLSEEPKYIVEETFIDIYKFTSQQRKQIKFLDRISQLEIQLKIKEGYGDFWGEGLKDPFRIVSINAKEQTTDIKISPLPLQTRTQLSAQIITNIIQEVLINPMIQIITKCGYMFSLIHQSTSQQKQQSTLNKERFSFVSQPIKLPEKVGQASLFQPKVISSSQQKQHRKNFVIKCLPLKNKESLILMNNCLMFKGNQQLSLIKLDDLKIGLFETTKQQEFFLSHKEFHQKYEKTSPNIEQDIRHTSLFGGRTESYSRQSVDGQRGYYRLFNNQTRWTVFDNEGRFHIYMMELKHIILSYLYFQCEMFTYYQRNQSRFDSSTHFLIESDLRLHSTIDKIIKVHGYCNFMKALIQILVNNSNDQREYFYFQKELFLEVVRKQFQFQLPSNFQDWSYGLGQHNQAQVIVPTEKMLQFVWIILFEHQSKQALNSQVIHSFSADSEYAKTASEYQQAKSKLQYSAYGYALKSLFCETIDVLVYFRAKQFKLKQKELTKCKQKLVQLFSYIQNKKHKSQTQEYKNYLEMKLINLSRKKQLHSQNYGNNLNATFTTNYSNSLNNTEESFLGLEEEPHFKTLLKGVSERSNDTVERDIYKSIQKIITLIDVMNIMIEKDERQGLPSFIQIVTNFKNQVKLGEHFFNEELLLTQGNVQFLHPQLVREVQKQLPELQVQKKIDFLKFKISRNIALDNSLNQIDLKSLNFDRLSSIISTSQIPQLRQMFLGQKQEIDFQKAQFYMEFLSICLSKMILKVKQLSVIKDQSNFFSKVEFGSLSEEVTKSQRTSSLMTHFTVQKIILAQQQLEYYQQEMATFFQQIKNVFAKSVQSLKKITGPRYYQGEKYLERIIELLIQNFTTEEILIQTLEIILKEANLFEKIHFMNQLKNRLLFAKNLQAPILNLPKEKQQKFTEKSTFQYLMGKNDKKLIEQRTYDTWGNESFNGRH